MRRLASFIGIAVLGCGLSACAAPQDSLSAIAPQSFSSSLSAPSAPPSPGREARPPSGYLAFCDRNPGECRGIKGQPDRVALGDQVWATLEKVNIVVNSTVRP